MKTLKKYVLAFSSKVRNYLIPEDTNLVKLFNRSVNFKYIDVFVAVFDTEATINTYNL